MIDSSDRPDLDDTVRLAHKCWRAAKEHSSAWRAMAPIWYDLVANKQWDDADIEKLEEERRIPVVINRVARTVNAIIGTQVNNRQETRFIPRELGDVQKNEILTAAAEWVRDGCEAEDEETDAFEDCTTCGMGWTITRMDYDYDQEGQTVIDRLDPMEMFWDPAARKRNLSDMRWCIHVREYGKDEFEDKWPDADMDLASAPWEELEGETSVRTHVYPQDAYKEQQGPSGREKGKAIKVAHFQWSVREPIYRVGKEAEELNEKQFKKIKDKLDAENIQYLKQSGLRWKQAFIAGRALLEDVADCPYPKGSTFKAITYKRDRNKNTWYGVVAAMMDPQKYGNKFLSLIMDIITKNSKGGVMMERDAVDDPKELEAKWARPDGIVLLNPGALSGNKVMPKPMTNLPAGLDRLVSYFLDSVHEVTGINLELLGMANREQAGVLENQRKQAGITIIAPLFDGLRRYRKEQGRVLLHFIQSYLSDGRLIRITGAGNEKFVPLVRQSDTAKFDVIVDEAPTSPNVKERTFAALAELMPALAKLGIPIPPEVLDYTPLPSSLISKWKELLQNAPSANPEQMKQMQDQMMKLGQENAQLKDKRQESAMTMQMNQQEVAAKMALEREQMQAKIEIERMKMQLEMEKLEMEKQKLAAEIGLERERAEAELLLAQERNEGDLELSRNKARGELDLKHMANKDMADAQSKGMASLKDESKPKIRRMQLRRDPKTGDLSGANIDGVEIVIERAA